MENANPIQERYKSIDGLRAYAAIAILSMHVLANGRYDLHGPVFERIIPSFSHLVVLFMIVSGFSMCCGYYEGMLSGRVPIGAFYSRRYKKIWPFFALLCLVDLSASPSIESVYEVFANLTLCYGLLPSARIEVIGVGWTLGVIFLFYMLFPFFCFLLETKKRAWFSFVVAVVFRVICIRYFYDEAHVGSAFPADRDFLYCAVYFLAGGLIYLYRCQLREFVRRFHWVVLLACFGAVALFFHRVDMFTLLLLMTLLLVYALYDSGGVLQNRFTSWLSGISMEVYICHTAVFRGLEKAGLSRVCGIELVNYTVTVLMTLIGSAAFASAFRWGMAKMKRRQHKNDDLSA